MKKKIIGLGIAVILVVLLLLLTGCGQEQETKNTNSKNNETIISDSNNENYVITNVIKSFDTFDTYITDGAVVQLNNNKDICYIIDGEGKILYEINDQNIVNAKNINVSYMNGYICYNNNMGTSYVTDLRTGNKIVEGSKTIECVDVTYDGFILQKITNEQISGTTYQVRIIDKDGNIIWEDSAEKTSNIDTLTDNYVIFDNILINAKTGKTTDLGVDAGKIGGKVQYNHIIVDNIIYDMNTDEIKLKFEGKEEIENLLNENYFYTYSGIYNVNDGTLEKDLTEGHIKNIYYKNNKYYVISDNGFYYILNDQFEYVYDPTKILTTAYPEAELTNFGVAYTGFENGERIQYYISYDEFKADEDLSSIEKKVPFESFMGGSDGVRVCTNRDYIIAFDENYEGRLINPNTLEDIKIHK